MCDLQRGHMKDFSHCPPIFRRGPRRKRARQIHSLLAARAHSIDQPRLSSSQPTKIVSSLLKNARSPDIQSSADQMESRLDVTKGQRHRGVEWIPDKNLTSSLRVVRCLTINRMFPAFHIFTQLLPGRWAKTATIRRSGSSSS